METIDRSLKNKTLEITLESIGWKSLLQIRAGTSRMLILKSVVRGLCLERGQPIYSYVGHDQQNRTVMVSYLDCKPRIIPKENES
ncbi:MAG: hypothetical protein ABH879_00375 [archaeon]